MIKLIIFFLLAITYLPASIAEIKYINAPRKYSEKRIYRELFSRGILLGKVIDTKSDKNRTSDTEDKNKGPFVNEALKSDKLSQKIKIENKKIKLSPNDNVFLYQDKILKTPSLNVKVSPKLDLHKLIYCAKESLPLIKQLLSKQGSDSFAQ